LSDPTAPAFVLSFHAAYACRGTTACCTAPWAVEVDADGARRLDNAIQSGTLRVPDAPAPGTWRAQEAGGVAVADHDATHAGQPVLIARARDGACAFLRHDRTCAIHADCGHDALPEACQQFPRVTLADDRGLHVTLSHYCPTVAALTWQPPADPVAILRAPASFARAPLIAGLDARGLWPPLLRPGVMSTPAAWSLWEAFVVGEFGNRGGDPFATLDRIPALAESLRSWTARSGDIELFTSALLGGETPVSRRAGEHAVTPFDPLEEWTRAWSAVPPERAVPPAVPAMSATVAALPRAVDELRRHGQAAGRYLAARGFASWSAYQGGGLRSHVASLRMALGVLVTEVARQMADPGVPPHPVSPALEAMRQADWLLVHLAESAPLARLWADDETPPAGRLRPARRPLDRRWLTRAGPVSRPRTGD
jgi:hypothetical protein